MALCSGATWAAGRANLTASPIDRDDQGRRQPVGLGWELRCVGEVGAVETAHPGRVWMGKDLAPATASEVACLLAGMLVYDPPEQRSR